MIWTDEKGQRHVVRLLAAAGGYSYVEFFDGSTQQVRTKELTQDTPRPGRPPSRHIPPPDKFVTPKQRK